jgi:hypothetical protein
VRVGMFSAGMSGMIVLIELHQGKLTLLFERANVPVDMFVDYQPYFLVWGGGGPIAGLYVDYFQFPDFR